MPVAVAGGVGKLESLFAFHFRCRWEVSICTVDDADGLQPCEEYGRSVLKQKRQRFVSMRTSCNE